MTLDTWEWDLLATRCHHARTQAAQCMDAIAADNVEWAVHCGRRAWQWAQMAMRIVDHADGAFPQEVC